MAVSYPPHIFRLEATIIWFSLGGKRTPPPYPQIYPQSLSTQYLVVRGSKKQQRRGGGGWYYSSFTKGETFLVSEKTKCYIFGVISPCTTLLCPFQKKTFFIPSVWSSREYTLTLI